MQHLQKFGFALALAAAALPAIAQATIINVSAILTGCSTCDGRHPAPGDTLGTIYNPGSFTFGPGTYTVTNAVGKEGALYYAWNFNSGSDHNWVWAFIIADHDTRKVLLDSLSPLGGAFSGTHSEVANSAYALNYSGTFTLTQTTDLSFLTEDYYGPDNLGGVSLDVRNVSAVPEPASWALMLVGFGVAGAALRRRHNVRTAAA